MFRYLHGQGTPGFDRVHSRFGEVSTIVNASGGSSRLEAAYIRNVIGGYQFIRSSCFHSFERESIKSLTHSKGLKDGPHGMGGHAGVAGSQGSDQTRVVCAALIDFRRPALRRG